VFLTLLPAASVTVTAYVAVEWITREYLSNYAAWGINKYSENNVFLRHVFRQRYYVDKPEIKPDPPSTQHKFLKSG
jgi:hypothetical protein